MKRLFVVVLTLAVYLPAFAQTPLPDYPARYDVGLSANFTKNRREAVLAKLPPDALAIFLNNPLRNRSNDTEFEYQPDRNTYYLTGSHEEGTFLLLSPAGIEVDGKTVKEILFVPPRNPQTETWNGRLFGADRAMKELGVALALDNTRFEEVLGKLLDSNKYKVFHMPFQDGLAGVEAPNPRWMPIITKSISYLKTQFTERKLSPNRDLLPQIMRELRGIKQPEEMQVLQKAIDISATAHLEAMQSAEPGMFEYQLEAILEYVYQMNGAAFPGYPSIVGSGENTTILHYNTNRRQIKNGDMILIDAAAEYMGYTADITRTFPANGKFSPEQKAIYELCLKAQNAAADAGKLGTPLNQLSIVAHNVIADGLMELGLLKERSKFRNFTLHGVAHHIGLDVHDWGGNKIEEGMVFTIEPGIYIKPSDEVDPKWWNIGVRIEDDYLATKDGLKLLSGIAPRSVADIEAAMRKKGLGNLSNGKLSEK
ncbi:MAG: aminopeptidase P N-terminal domain-containing protein [Rhodothermia bacterium]|nr:aminopeptidase P N-terminal domain-containing protein [Rhodothermia bacterium]